MRKTSLVVVCGIVVLVAGCGGGKAVKEDAARRGPCMFPDDRVTPAPEWVCTRSYPGVEVAAVGSHAKSTAGYEFQKNMAAAAARVELAKQVKVDVRARVTKHTSEKIMHSVNLDDVTESNEATTRQITNETLTGSRIYEVSTNPKTGALFVLVGINRETADRIARDALRNYMQTDPSRWQKLEEDAKRGDADLDRSTGGASGKTGE